MHVFFILTQLQQMQAVLQANLLGSVKSAVANGTCSAPDIILLVWRYVHITRLFSSLAGGKHEILPQACSSTRAVIPHRQSSGVCASRRKAHCSSCSSCCWCACSRPCAFAPAQCTCVRTHWSSSRSHCQLEVLQGVETAWGKKGDEEMLIYLDVPLDLFKGCTPCKKLAASKIGSGAL